jgi:hypothetical protein
VRSRVRSRVSPETPLFEEEAAVLEKGQQRGSQSCLVCLVCLPLCLLLAWARSGYVQDGGKALGQEPLLGRFIL